MHPRATVAGRIRAITPSVRFCAAERGTARGGVFFRPPPTIWEPETAADPAARWAENPPEADIVAGALWERNLDRIWSYARGVAPRSATRSCGLIVARSNPAAASTTARSFGLARPWILREFGRPVQLRRPPA